jgi:hypothetical protein
MPVESMKPRGSGTLLTGLLVATVVWAGPARTVGNSQCARRRYRRCGRLAGVSQRRGRAGVCYARRYTCARRMLLDETS